MKTNPTPTQQETLERFVLDKSDCVNGGDGCKAEMRHSIAGAFVYHSEIERARAAVAGPRGDAVDAERLAATVVALWRAENSDDRTLVKYIKQSLLGTRIGAAATSSPTPAESDDAPSDVDELLFRLAARDCERLAAGGDDCSDEFPFAEWCVVCQSRGLLQKYFRAAPAERTRVAGEQEHTMEDYELDRNLKYTCPKCGGLWKAAEDAEQCHGVKPCTKESDCAALSHFGDCRSMPTVATTSDSARRAAEEIRDQVLEILRTQYPEIKWPGGTISSIAFDVITKHFAAAPADNDAESLEVRFCWVCRSNHRLIASECRAMDKIA